MRFVLLSLNGRDVRCALARTPNEHVIGLSRHASLEADEGMLFLFGRPRTATFWMSSVPFPIDIIGLDPDSRVTRIVQGALPGSTERWTFYRCAAVLEVPAGTARDVALKIGDVVGAQEGHRTADSSNEWSPQVQEIRKRDDRGAPDSQGRGHDTPDELTKSSPEMYDEPGQRYFETLWGDALANEAIDPNERPELQTRTGSRRTAGRNIVVSIPAGRIGEVEREERDVADREALGEKGIEYFWQMGRLPKEDPQRIYFAWNGAVRAYHDVTRIARDEGRIYMNSAIHDLPRPVEMQPFRGFRYFDYPAMPPGQKTAQIVDEQKFVEKVARILLAHAQEIPWEPDRLNGGATERAVVSRSDLARWLSGNQETGTGAAELGSESYVLQAASSERGLQLIGTAFVLADMADFTRMGFAGRQPTLVLYREAGRDHSPAPPSPLAPPTSPAGP